MATTPPVKRLFVFQHLGMGDAIICNGMIRTLAKQHPKVCPVTDARYIHAVRMMYRDVPNIQVLATITYEEVEHRWKPVHQDGMYLGYFAAGFNPKKFVQEFYRQSGVPLDARWDAFELPVGFFKPPPVDTDVLVHDSQDRGFGIYDFRLPTGRKITRITRRNNFWDWLPEIRGAKEIHCIDSSYLNLVDSMWYKKMLQPDVKLVWHWYARPLGKSAHDSGSPAYRAPWEILLK
jgi:hypothetical protein